MHVNPGEVSVVADEETLEAAKKLTENKFPGPNRSPNIALKVAARTVPSMFAQVFTAYFRKGDFTGQLKLQNVIPISNSDKPLGLVNSVNKLFERVIYYICYYQLQK